MSNEVLLTETKSDVIVTYNTVEIKADNNVQQVIVQDLNTNIGITDLLHPVIEILTGKNGKDGDDGLTYVPTVSNGVLKWSTSGTPSNYNLNTLVTNNITSISNTEIDSLFI